MSAEAAPPAQGHGPGPGHGEGPHEVELSYPVAHQIDDADQQHNAAVLGMWSFLATEVLFFGGLFLAYAIIRAGSPLQVKLASHHLNIWLGGLNTAVLLGSSLLVALAVRDAQLRDVRRVIFLLIGTIALGGVFLGIKAIEWTTDYHEGLMPFVNWQMPQEDREELESDPKIVELKNSPDAPPGAAEEAVTQYQMFVVLYFFMTGLHALHLIIGMVIIAIVCRLAWKKRTTGGYVNMIEVTGLYWHFIDIVWVFLYPLLYLVDRKVFHH
jgi:cytochrome c oxidase subunit 3